MPIQPRHLRLKDWLEGESLREKITQSKSTDEIVENLYSYLTLICGEKDWDKYPWMEIAQIYEDAVTINRPSLPFPMLVRGKSEKGEKSPWEYDERTWYVWAHALAAKYGWQLEYIAEIEINDAIGLMQEIIINDNLEKEWHWNLSELTYSYDAQSKTTKHHEFPWPSWMLPEPSPAPKIKVPKSMMPVGLIIGNDDHVKH